MNPLHDLGLDPSDQNGSLPNEPVSRAVRPALSAPRRRAFVIGAGVTGLTAAWQMAAGGMDVVVLEATRRVGGMATTFKYKDYSLDQGPHKFFSVMTDRMKMAEEIMGDGGFLEVPKISRIRLDGRFLNYPIGLIDVLKNLNPTIAVSGGLSYLFQLARNLVDRRPDVSYEDWLVRRFGRRLYELIFAAYARKIWGDPKTLARELAETRVAIPGLLPLLWRMLFARKSGPVIHAETFKYPKMGSGEFSRRIAELVLQNGGTIRYGSLVTKILLENGRVSSLCLGSGKTIVVAPDDAVVTTIPTGYLTKIIEPTPSRQVLEAADNLKTHHLILLYVLLNRPFVSKDTWLFFPETKYIFSRVFEQKNFSPYMVPQSTTCLCLEIVASDPNLWRSDDALLYERAIAGLEELGLVKRAQVIEYITRRMKWVYPVYDLNYKKNSTQVLSYLDGISNLFSVGRQGGFNYVGQIDCLDIGVITAQHVLAGDRKVHWQQARQRFASYTVLD